MAMSTLTLRVLSAAILIPVVLFALIHSTWSFLCLVAVAVIISCYEWVNLARLLSRPVVLIAAGFLYIGLSFYCMAQMRLAYPPGLGLTLALLLSIWASDTGAYLSGKTIGGPKMAPSISPNKTWAGLIGGMLSSALALYAYAQYVGPALAELTGVPSYIALEMLSISHLLIFGAFLTIAGQIGDLLISYFKRKAGVKDTGALIPGHGGLLDRIDALLLAAPVYFFLIVMASGKW